MNNYLDLLAEILKNGERQSNRTGVDTLSLFGRQLRFDLQAGYPLITTKKCYFKAIVGELLWFISGSSNIAALQQENIHIWDEWADANGELGPVYGVQWRKWQAYSNNQPTTEPQYIDQLTQLIDGIKNSPNSRRHIISAWNAGQIDEMNLPPCHLLCQFSVRSGNLLSCQMYQRSADYFLGVPFNIASYALLTAMLAQVCGYKPGELIITFGDVHLYENHLPQAKEQLSRTPKQLPSLELNHQITEIEKFDYQDIRLIDYNPHPTIKANIAV